MSTQWNKLLSIRCSPFSSWKLCTLRSLFETHAFFAFCYACMFDNDGTAFHALLDKSHQPSTKSVSNKALLQILPFDDLWPLIFSSFVQVWVFTFGCHAKWSLLPFGDLWPLLFSTFVQVHFGCHAKVKPVLLKIVGFSSKKLKSMRYSQSTETVLFNIFH